MSRPGAIEKSPPQPRLSITSALQQGFDTWFAENEWLSLRVRKNNYHQLAEPCLRT
jgi:hypothetical protein